MKTTQGNADRIFSRYIRLKHSNNGYCKCVTCGAIKKWDDIDCGHFVKRGHMALRYDEYNAAPQCAKCNRFSGGMQDEYAAYIINTHGIEMFERLMRLKKIPYTRSLEMLYLSVVEEYGPKVKALLMATPKE